MSRAFFVTSSGTEIGKTLVTAALIHQAREMGLTVEAAKPVLSGFDANAPEGSDAGILLSALGHAITDASLDAITPYRFAPALSPDMAAKREGRDLHFGTVVDASKAAIAKRADLTLIEGVGGVMAPIDARHTVLDWMVALGAPAVLVVGGYLGTISHTLTAAATLQNRGITIAGIVLSGRGDCPVPLAETAAAIARFVPDVPQALVSDLGDAPEPWRRAPDLLTPLNIRHIPAS